MSDNFLPSNRTFQPTLADHPRHAVLTEPLISLYQDGEASRSEQQLLDEYLDGCSACRGLFAQYTGLENRLRSYMAGIPEPHLQPSDYAFLNEQPASRLSGPRNQARLLQVTPHTTGLNQTRLPRRRPVAFSAAALVTAAALIVGIAGFLLIASLGNHPSSPTLDNQVGIVTTPTPPASATTVAPTSVETPALTAETSPTSAATTVAPAYFGRYHRGCLDGCVACPCFVCGFQSNPTARPNQPTAGGLADRPPDPEHFETRAAYRVTGNSYPFTHPGVYGSRQFIVGGGYRPDFTDDRPGGYQYHYATFRANYGSGYACSDGPMRY